MPSDDLPRTPPTEVRRALRREVNFGCPVPRCSSPFLEYHHFDPPWHIRHHHDVEGLIPLCPTHHAQADAFTVGQLRDFKTAAHDRPATGRFEWLRRELVKIVGGGLYYDQPTIVQLGSERIIWFNRDEAGHALLNVQMLTTSGRERMIIEDNDFTVLGRPVDFESPPSGRLLKIRYDNGDYLRVEFRQIKTLAAAFKAFSHIRRDGLEETVQQWPATFVTITMNVTDSPINLGPKTTTIPGATFEGAVVPHGQVVFLISNVPANRPIMTSRKVYTSQVIYLADLIDKNNPFAELQGLTFTGCQIIGPMVILLRAAYIEGCNFIGETDELLYEFPDGSAKIGGLGFVDCKFINCEFRGIGIMGSPGMLAPFREIFN